MTGQPEPGGYTSGNVLYCQYGCGPATVLVIIGNVTYRQRPLGMTVNWRVDDPATEVDERMALGQARGPLREPGPDEPVGTEDETGEP